MKKFILLTAFFGVMIALMSFDSQTNPDPDAPIMKFEQDTIDYGTIPYGADGVCYFQFVNTGNEPLRIKECHGSCGCVIATWTVECLIRPHHMSPFNPG